MYRNGLCNSITQLDRNNRDNIPPSSEMFGVTDAYYNFIQIRQDIGLFKRFSNFCIIVASMTCNN